MEFSSCCDVEADGNRCTSCGKFCKTVPCSVCEGYFIEKVEVGDEVGFFVCPESRSYLRAQFKKGTTKYFTGKVTETLEKGVLLVKIPRKVVNLHIEDIDTL